MTKEIREKFRQLTPTEWTEEELELFRKEVVADEKLFYEETLKNNPPLPPWIVYPDFERQGIGWRMGAGEDLLNDLYTYFQYCGKQTFKEYMLANPEPKDWNGWYKQASDYI